jgi:hypothetical protein
MKPSPPRTEPAPAAHTASPASTGGPCRFCRTELDTTFVDLGMSPLCESLIDRAHLDRAETFLPLHVWVCRECWLVQLQEYVSPEEIFREYAYFSSYSTAWLAHASDYSEMVVKRLSLSPASFVVELASNDGYLLRNFVRKGIPCLGIEPAVNVARVAVEKGVPSLTEFFGVALAERLVREKGRADLVLGNNVLAQVPDLNDFVGGMKILLAPGGTITMEFPHLVRLMEENQFDTIYHEHFSYFSLLCVERIFGAHGLVVFDVEELWTHGGSLRIWARHASATERPVSERVLGLRRREESYGLRDAACYARFEERVRETKRKLLEFLVRAKREGKKISGYGAPGKGNTLLNYCGIRTDFLDFTVDRNPYKHGRFTPGTHIPIFPPEKIDAERPDYVLILPWNLQEEITKQMAHIAAWGGKFVVPIPEVRVVG